MATASSSANVTVPFEQEQLPEDGIDKTAHAIAEIFGVDLADVGDNNKATELIVDTIYAFIAKFQECQQELADTQQQLADTQDVAGLDEDGNPIEDPNDQQASDETQTDPDVDPNEIPQQLPAGKPTGKQLPPAKPGQQQVKPGLQRTGAQVPPQAAPARQTQPVAPQQQPAKKPNPFAKKPPIQASHSDGAMRTIAKMRRDRILQLSQAGYFKPPVAQKMIQQYCSPDSLALSLSNDGSPDGFDTAIELAIENGPVLDYSEKTGPQDNYRELINIEASGGQATNPLVADAATRKA